MIFISRYTQTGDYPKMAKRLEESLKRFDLPCSIHRVNDHGSWRANVDQKPAMILAALMIHRQTVVWLDADSEVMQLPTLLLGTSADFAAYNWAADADNPIGVSYQPKRLRVSGGTLLWGYTAPAFELLCRWIHAVNKAEGTGMGTDPILDNVFNTAQPPVNSLWLPSSYVRVPQHFPDVEPVIDHDYGEYRHQKLEMFTYPELYEDALQAVPDGGVIVEVGCWLGDSSAYMAKMIRDGERKVKFYCVDTWQGTAHLDWMQDAVAQYGGDMFPRWRQRMRDEGLDHIATPMQMPSIQAAKHFADESVDFIMIDGDHRYEAVIADIRAWLPKLKPNGVIAGDDYDKDHFDVCRAVQDALPNAEIDGRQWRYVNANNLEPVA